MTTQRIVNTEIEPDIASDAACQTPPAAVPHTPESALRVPCNCPCHQTPTPKPTQSPFPATEANRKLTQQWLLDYYKSITFNTCEHQPLPLMEGVPMRLMVDPTEEPVAHHTPVLVSLHWQTEVKAGLDQDVSLGVLEPVGKPMTGCHCMVV